MFDQEIVCDNPECPKAGRCGGKCAQNFDCEYLGEIDGSCGKDRCWAYDHQGPRCTKKVMMDVVPT